MTSRPSTRTGPSRRQAPLPAPGWQEVRLDGPLLWLPAGVRLDLGATAKGLGSDRAARAVMAATGHTGGVLISLGGDIATAGIPPRDGWPIVAADRPDQPGPRPASAGPAQLVRLPRGAVATSSISCRSWRRAGRVTPPHRGSAHRAARRRPVADGQRGRDDLRRCQRRRHRGDRGRRGRPRAGWPRRACPRGWSATTARCATSAAGPSMTAARSRFRRAATCTPGPDRAQVHDERR